MTFLFHTSIVGANASAVTYSMIYTAKTEALSEDFGVRTMDILAMAAFIICEGNAMNGMED